MSAFFHRRCRDLQVDESALTGKTAPVIKKEEALDPETILADRGQKMKIQHSEV